MKNKKIPLVAIYFIFSVVWGLYIGGNTLKMLGQNTAIMLIVDLLAKIYISIALIRGKRDINVFIPIAIIAATKAFVLINAFSVFALLSCIAYLVLVFFVGTAVFPAMEKYKGKVKSFYAIPALIILGVTAYTNMAFYGIISLETIVDLLVVPAMYYMLPLWCFEMLDEKKPSRNAERFFFKLLAIVIAVVAAIVILPQKTTSKPSNNQKPSDKYDSFADYVKNEDPDLYNEMQNIYDDAVGNK